MPTHGISFPAMLCLFAGASLTVLAGPSFSSESTPVYAGVAAGQAHLAGNDDFGWAAVIGTRPIPLLGAEFQYVDFGHTDSNTSPDFPSLHTDAKASGVALFAVGYAPLPVSNLDLYLKAGVSRLKNTVTREYTPIPIDVCILAPTAAECGSHVQATSVHVAWGAGIQFHIAQIALRADYERFTAASDHPSLLSFGVTYDFP